MEKIIKPSDMEIARKIVKIQISKKMIQGELFSFTDEEIE
jgi:hypothetical protein